MKLGCAWYPEQWDEARWNEDLRLMREAGMNVVRVGEFAWSRLEPAEGQFELDWLERAITLAASYELQTVLGTPSAAPPAWLTQRYPEVLAVRADGQRATHGARCHFSPTNPTYRSFCRRIAEELASRFGRNQSVIGWQIDNEYNAESWDAETGRQFQEWVKASYKSLEQLNKRWTTTYWSQEYTAWEQIPLPAGWSGHNPGLALEYKRFITDVYRGYQREQLEAIRAKAEPRQWITHNFMGWYGLFDHYTLSEELDLASWDNYVGSGHLDFLANGAVHDLTRGFKRKNFWLMETQPGWVNWSGVGNVLYPGEVRCMAWHAVGHGADAVLYWQWRSALNGQEQYHGSLVGADGAPRPLYPEVAQLGKDFAQFSELLEGTEPVSPVAILHSYEDRWAIDYQRHHRDFDPVQHLQSFYKPLRALLQAVDIVHPQAPLKDYKLVVAPNLHILHNPLLKAVSAYLQGGGHLVLGPRSGFKDAFNALLPSRQPSVLAQGLGAHVEEFYALEEPVPLEGRWGNGQGKIWGEWLKQDAADAEVLLSYGKGNGWLDGQPALITRSFGAGRLTYLATWPDEELMKKFVAWLADISKITPAFGPLPEGVEVCKRVGNGKEVYILINHSNALRQVNLPRPMQDLFNDRRCERNVSVKPRDVVVLTP